MTDDRIPMTREGYDKLKAELDRLRSTEMIEITKRVATARDMGDLSENAEYHAAREDQGMLQARINDMSDRLARAVIVDTERPAERYRRLRQQGQGDGPGHGRRRDVRTGRPRSGEPDKGRILTSSPIGQGLIGKKKGDTAEITVPRGTMRFKILDISAAGL